MTTTVPPIGFPESQQAQIIRAHQRDTFHVLSLREQADNVLRSWLGSRWLSKWNKEVDLLSMLVYYGLTTGRAGQTLGEEYTDIWQYSHRSQAIPPRGLLRMAMVLLPTLPRYLLGYLTPHLHAYPRTFDFLKSLPTAIELLFEANLALFYFQGRYYDPIKRLLGIRHVSSQAVNPNVRPPSYSLLGILLGFRLLYRLYHIIRARMPASATPNKKSSSNNREVYLDNRLVSELRAEDDDDPQYPDNTMLDLNDMPSSLAGTRNCTLCLEERTNTTSTECGHLFCWTCISGWAREKAECPLCRQSLDIRRLWPIYNM